MAQPDAGGGARRGDTRARALAVALRMFAERGYANTSLREIADRLGVTKAALYFHYRSKDDLLAAILREYVDDLGDLLDDAAHRPASPATGEWLLRELAQQRGRWGSDLLRLIRQNYAEISRLPVVADMRQAHRRLLLALSGPGADLADRVRAQAALVALEGPVLLPGDDDDEQATRAAALAVALEIVRARP